MSNSESNRVVSSYNAPSNTAPDQLLNLRSVPSNEAPEKSAFLPFR